MSKKIEASGKTIAEALEKACRELGAGLDEIEYEVIQLPQKAFLGIIGGQEAKIVASIKVNAPNDEKDFLNSFDASADDALKLDKLAGSNEASFNNFDGKFVDNENENSCSCDNRFSDYTESRKPQYKSYVHGVDIKTLPSENKFLAKAETFLSDLISAMDRNISVYRHENKSYTSYELVGEHMGVLIGKRGQVLDAMQYLTNLVANKGNDEERVRIILDIEGYRSRREKTLVRLARSLATKACRINREVHLEPMNRHDRRIIHLTLQDNRRIETYSTGDEPNRYVVIVPKRSNYQAR